MIGRGTVLNFAAAVLCAASAAGAAAQDFQRTYNLGAGGRVEIRADGASDINLTGYDGSVIVVSAFKQGRDGHLIEVEDASTAGSVSLHARYAENCRCDASVGVRFEVRVPRSAGIGFGLIGSGSGDVKAEGFTGRLRLSSAIGDVSVRRMGGEIEAFTASGTVRVADVTGTVNATSYSGNVEVEFARLDGAGEMKFSSAHGDVHVRMPSHTDARVSLYTFSGGIETNFPIEVRQSPQGHGTRAEGRLGSGARTLLISSVSGNVSLKGI